MWHRSGRRWSLYRLLKEADVVIQRCVPLRYRTFVGVRRSLALRDEGMTHVPCRCHGPASLPLLVEFRVNPESKIMQASWLRPQVDNEQEQSRILNRRSKQNPWERKSRRKYAQGIYGSKTRLHHRC